jgi:disulfide oxidoreductase YuzD
MDPITTAIVAALPALAADMVKSSVKDAYEGLKAVIRRKWGEADPAVRAVDALESDPTSEGHTVILQERITAAKATEDVEIMQAAAKLIAKLRQ